MATETKLIGFDVERFTASTSEDARIMEMSNLAQSLMKQYQATSDTNLLVKVVDLQREVLHLRPEGHLHRDESSWDLALSLRAQYESGGDQSRLAEAIDLLRETLRLRPPGHPKRYTTCFKLSGTLRLYYTCAAHEHLLTEAIELADEALNSSPPDDPLRHRYYGGLASSLWMLHNLTGDEISLVKAIDLHSESLKLRPSGHSERHLACDNLAMCIQSHYDRTGNEHLLTKTIDLSREALSLRPPGHSARHYSCANLAFSLQSQYIRTKDHDLLIEAIALDHEGLTLRPPGHPDRDLSCENLAKSLWMYYNHTGDESLLVEAIRLNRESLKLRPLGHSDRHRACGNLAQSLQTQYTRTSDDNLLVEAIQLHRESLELRPQGHPYRQFSCANLASSLLMSYTRSGDGSLLSEVIELLREGATLASVHEKWRNTIELSSIHLLRGTPHYNVTLAAQYLSESVQSDPEDLSDAMFRALLILDQLWDQSMTRASPPFLVDHTVASIYRRIITLLPLFANPAFDLASQFQRLRDVRRVGADAFINATLVGDWRAGLEHLEAAQGIIWAQRLHQRDPHIHNVPDEQKDELELCLRELSTRNVMSDTSPSRSDLHRYSARMYAVIRVIRAMPGLDRFMLGESFKTLCDATAQYPAVVLVAGRGHFYALVIASGQICGNAPLKLELTEELLYSASVYDKLSLHRGAPSSEINGRGVRVERRLPSLDLYLKSLWVKVVKPILDVLRLQASSSSPRPRLFWCPTGPFTSVPLHAAGIYDGPISQRQGCTDYVVSSYTPTLTTLIRAQHSAQPLAKNDLALLLVAEKQAQESLVPIPGVDHEIQDIAGVAASHRVKIVDQVAGSTTIAHTSTSLTEANIVHLACHGVQDPTDATNSGFCLGDGRLTISELTSLNIKHGFLAFLSACETAKGSEDQPDQAMHLAAAMLFVGFKSVIATMWAISDEDSPRVAKWFYEQLFAQQIIDADAVAYALDNAVRQLRESGVPSHRWVPFIHMGA